MTHAHHPHAHDEHTEHHLDEPAEQSTAGTGSDHCAGDATQDGCCAAE
ncbi:hypothetical protein [Acrocarpospora pleiomorpha]|nr:hypothetical protein [Acrocarpospora pleiomorpha]